jgi:hypothetical protein
VRAAERIGGEFEEAFPDFRCRRYFLIKKAVAVGRA